MAFLRLRGLLVFLVLCTASAACAQGMPAAVERQEIAVTLVPERNLVVGQSTITFAAGTKSVSLRLSERATIGSVTVAGKDAPFAFAAGVLSLRLQGAPEPLPVTVSYRANFNDAISRHPAASEDPSYGVSGAITKQGTFLGGEAYWYPVPAQVPARRSISISAPAGTEGITDGKLVSRSTNGTVTRSLWEEARPVGVLSLCAGPYRVEQRRLGGIDLYTYFYPGNASLAPRYLDSAARHLKFYQDLFGPYPFEKFAMVENFFPTGYGFPSFTLLGGTVIRLPFIVDTSLPHEIAHSWWGNGVEVDAREGNWSEGLVTYLADYLLKERHSPAQGKDYRRQLLVDYASLVTPANDFPLSAFQSRSDPASRAIGYGKGAMVFHMIRSEIGDDSFFQALRQVCRDHMYRSASWSDLIRAFSRSAGRDLAPLLQGWLTRPGGPHLFLADVTSRREKGGWIVSGSIVQDTPLFRVGVPLRLETEHARVEEVVTVLGERTPFAISAVASPRRLLLDPDAEIFRIPASGEIPATVNSIKGSSGVIGVMTENCRAASGTFKALLASLSQGNAPVMDEDQLSDTEVARHDLVFCGTPRDRSLLPRLPVGFDLEKEGFSVDGARFSEPDSLLFLVASGPEASGRVVSLFLPLSEAAAVKYSPKITHYGKYGYLVFSAGANRHKGTAATVDKGVAVDL